MKQNLSAKQQRDKQQRD